MYTLYICILYMNIYYLYSVQRVRRRAPARAHAGRVRLCPCVRLCVSAYLCVSERMCLEA